MQQRLTTGRPHVPAASPICQYSSLRDKTKPRADYALAQDAGTASPSLLRALAIHTEPELCLGNKYLVHTRPSCCDKRSAVSSLRALAAGTIGGYMRLPAWRSVRAWPGSGSDLAATKEHSCQSARSLGAALVPSYHVPCGCMLFQPVQTTLVQVPARGAPAC